jgi:hypothetical protein
MSAYEIAEQKGPLTWRLAQKEEENIAEEAVVRLQGIICENHLLPSFEQNR